MKLSVKLQNLKSRLISLKNDDVAPYWVEEEIVKAAKLFEGFLKERYARETGTHWEGDRSMLVGMVGQTTFQMILQQYCILSDPNEPIIDWRHDKDYDFKVILGTIEVKSVDYYCKKVIIKASEWHSNDFLVVLKFSDRKPQKVFVMGWLTSEQVESIPITPKGESKFTSKAAARVIDLKQLNPFYDLFKRMVSKQAKVLGEYD